MTTLNNSSPMPLSIDDSSVSAVVPSSVDDGHIARVPAIVNVFVNVVDDAVVIVTDVIVFMIIVVTVHNNDVVSVSSLGNVNQITVLLHQLDQIKRGSKGNSRVE